jgi:molybdopterin-guanine dinucleotide biosynthesis protein B
VNHHEIPILGFVASSGTGKTTLLTELIPQLTARGLRVGLIKHAHHRFDIDHPGKDSYKLREAGATPVLIASRHRWALMVETEYQPEPCLNDLIPHLLLQQRLDLILVEGFKHEPFPKIELHRATLGYPLLYPGDSSIIAVATDTPLTTLSIPQLNLNQIRQLVDFIINRFSFN